MASVSVSESISKTTIEASKAPNTKKTFIIPMTVEAYETQSKLATKKALEELSNQMKDLPKPKPKYNNFDDIDDIDDINTDTDYELKNENSKTDSDKNSEKCNSDDDYYIGSGSGSGSTKKRKPSNDVVNLTINHIADKKQKKTNPKQSDNKSSSNISSNQDSIYTYILTQHASTISKLESEISKYKKELSLVKSSNAILKTENNELETKIYFMKSDNCNNTVYINKLKDDNEKLTKSIENNSIINKKYIEILKKENDAFLTENKKKDAIIKKNNLHMHFMKLLILFLLVMYILA